MTRERSTLMTNAQPASPQTETAKSLLLGWLSARLSPEAFGWLEQQVAVISGGERAQQLGIAVGLAPRKVGKADLDLTPAEREDARRARKDLDTTGWSVDQAARSLLVLASFKGDEAAFASGLDRIFVSAEIGEQIALLRGLPLFPAAKRVVPHAVEGVRSAMQPIFEAVAHRNPFPREEFSEAQWNQMVVKTLFIGSTLAPIQGLDERRNPELALMLFDYARERRAAGRPVSHELWRCVGPFAGAREVGELANMLANGVGMEAKAAALALSECPLPEARSALATSQALSAAIGNGHLTWNDIV